MAVFDPPQRREQARRWAAHASPAWFPLRSPSLHSGWFEVRPRFPVQEAAAELCIRFFKEACGQGALVFMLQPRTSPSQASAELKTVWELLQK